MQVDNELAEPGSNAFFMQQHLNSLTTVKHEVQNDKVLIDVNNTKFQVDQKFYSMLMQH